MKRIFLLLTAVLLTAGFAQAQTHNITGSVIDTTKQTVPGTTVKLKTEKGDSTTRVTGMDGKFTFSNINATKVTLTITSVGYQGVVKHFTFTNDNKPLEVGAVILKSMSTLLKGVTVVGITPVTLKEDTTVYNAAAYKVRDNAPTEDLVRKLPGVDVDADGNISTKGKQVTKVRINGKDVFGGDLQSITKNLPADVVESIQMIDDYGDQANLTGVKTGDPTQVMNITIRKDKNYGYSANITGGDGRDALPTPAATTANPNPTAPNQDNRYVGLVNAFKFKGDQQIYLLGNLNNVNANTFSFGGAGGGGGGNRGGGGGNGGGGGGNGGGGNGGGGGGNRGGGSSSTPNGISDVHTAGFNYRDQWGKDLSVYGSYSFADNSVYTVIGKIQSNIGNGSKSATNSIENDKNVNHRFTWNMEWKPDTVNYVKFTPTFSYTSTRAVYSDSSSNTGSAATRYTSTNYSTATAPNYGINLLYNHRFNGHGRNFSDYVTANSSHSDADQNPIYKYILGVAPVPLNQTISTGSRVNSVNNNLSYLEPLSTSGRSYLEFNYNFSYSHTTSDKFTDFLNPAVNPPVYVNNPLQSNNYVYNFMTNKFSLNYRFVEKKYNYTLGLGVQPSVLDGSSPVSGSTHVSNFNFVPTARYVYNFSRSQAFNATYSGTSNQPTFDQLQPVLDQSNALYPVQGNPNLKPEFNNSFNVRYNQFSFNTGDVLFFNLNYQQTNDKIVTNLVYTPHSNVVTTKYLNAEGYNASSAYFNYTKPWDNRKFSAGLGGNISYTNNISFITDTLGQTAKNTGKTLNLSPQFKFRTDFTDVIDAQFITTYTVSKIDNSIQNALLAAGSNVRALQLQLIGKNYFWKNWTLSYDYRKTFNSGYTIPVTNPNILNVYVERRFLKNNMATIRVSGNDLFNQNAGYSVTQNAGSTTQTNTNQLGRYFLLTLNIRLQKFAGKAPDQGNGRGDRMPGERGNRGDRGPGGMGGGGGFGGPGGE